MSWVPQVQVQVVSRNTIQLPTLRASLTLWYPQVPWQYCGISSSKKITSKFMDLFQIKESLSFSISSMSLTNLIIITQHITYENAYVFKTLVVCIFVFVCACVCILYVAYTYMCTYRHMYLCVHIQSRYIIYIYSLYIHRTFYILRANIINPFYG